MHISAYLCIFTHICAYLWIFMHIYAYLCIELLGTTQTLLIASPGGGKNGRHVDAPGVRGKRAEKKNFLRLKKQKSFHPLLIHHKKQGQCHTWGLPWFSTMPAGNYWLQTVARGGNVHVCICVKFNARVCMHVHMCAYMCICVHICASVCIWVHLCACECVHMCPYVSTPVHK